MDHLSSNPLGIGPVDRGGPQAVVAAPPQNRTFQFSLHALLLFTALVACVLLLVLLKGWGILVVVVGLAVTWLNSRGAFTVWQQSDRLHWPIRTGWMLLGLSLFLPSFRACGHSDLAGWETGQTCASMQIDTDWETIKKEFGLYALFTLLNTANVLVLGSVFWAWRLRRGRGQLYTTLFGCAATAAWTAAVPAARGLLIGYYVWCLAQLCMLSAARPGSRTLIAMCLVATVRVFFWPLEGNLFVLAVEPVRKAPLRTVSVTGTVTLDGVPCANVYVTFFPESSETGRPRVGVTDAQGRFQLQTSVGGSTMAAGVVPGDYVITVSGPENAVGAGPQIDLPEVYGQVHASPLRQTVVADNPSDIALALRTNLEMAQPQSSPATP